MGLFLRRKQVVYKIPSSLWCIVKGFVSESRYTRIINHESVLVHRLCTYHTYHTSESGCFAHVHGPMLHRLRQKGYYHGRLGTVPHLALKG